MKLDVDYVKQILQIMEDNNNVFIECGLLMQEIGASSKTPDYHSSVIDKEKLKKFVKHLYDLRDLGCIEGETYDMGFRLVASGGYIINAYAKYRMTINGHRLLDIMKNDTWWNKIKSISKDVTLETLKQAPSIIISTILNMPQ